MQCQNCKELLPDDSTFCQYCGAMLDADAQTACPDAGQRETMTTPEIGLRRRASRKRERGRKAPRFLFPVLTIVFCISTVASLVWGIQTTSALETQLAQKSAKVDQLQEATSMYHTLKDALTSGTYGYASNNFGGMKGSWCWTEMSHISISRSRPISARRLQSQPTGWAAVPTYPLRKMSGTAAQRVCVWNERPTNRVQEPWLPRSRFPTA